MPEAKKLAETYRSIPLDETKRHFVFGDIHGRFTTFQRLLESIEYNASTDVIYSVGDMIDRGPDSVSVVEFFQQSHCHAVLGNHEQMMVDFAYWEPVWMNPQNGGPATMDSLDQHGYKREWLAEICSELPICLDVGDCTQASSFRLIHAECPLEWTESELMKYLSKVPRQEVAGGRLLWGRTDIEAVCDELEYGIRYAPTVAKGRSSRAVFCGHTPVEDVVSAFNVHWIDTFEGYKMTCIEPVSKAVYQLPFEECDR